MCIRDSRVSFRREGDFKISKRTYVKTGSKHSIAGAYASIADDITSNIKWKYRDKGSMVAVSYTHLDVYKRQVHYVSDRIAVMQNGRIVELGDAREVFHHPQQEYTKMLLNSILEPKAYSEDRDS